ncbi:MULTISPECIES: NADH:ubiquinone oxidoreductase [unclassified Roseovarius]|uniref:NADH:ubiquinone oxidoreductase n=1 Tax=unclassified Roseovarius TaxID=2614913 RepID=UPI002740205C|nr:MULTISPECIES: NADH:ubiquinone oxidoreductase [unclassified Roseovarius]
MSTTENWSTCRIVCWALAAIGGLAMMIGMSSVVGWFFGIIFGIVTVAVLGSLFQKLVCTGEPEGSASMLDMGRTALEKAKEASGVAPAAATAKPAAEPKPVEAKPAAAAPAPAPKPEPATASSDEDADEGTKPQVLSEPQDGKADDLKRIKGVGPKLEQQLQSMGIYHFRQVASWSGDEVAWMDANLKGFRGRVSRDGWVEQAKTLAAGGETEFSKRVEDGDVY